MRKPLALLLVLVLVAAFALPAWASGGEAAPPEPDGEETWLVPAEDAGEEFPAEAETLLTEESPAAEEVSATEGEPAAGEELTAEGETPAVLCTVRKGTAVLQRGLAAADRRYVRRGILLPYDTGTA